MKKKLQIINIELGIDPEKELTKEIISGEINGKIDNAINMAVKEKELIKKVVEKRRQKEKNKEDIIKTCYTNLLENTLQNKWIDRDQLLKLSNGEELRGILLRIRNFLKKDGEKYELKSRTRNKQTQYILTIKT